MVNLNKSFSKKSRLLRHRPRPIQKGTDCRQLQTAKSVADCQVSCRLPSVANRHHDRHYRLTRQLQTVLTIRTTLDSREKFVLIWLVTPLKCGTRIITCILGQGHCKTVDSDYLTLYTPEVQLVYQFYPLIY